MCVVITNTNNDQDDATRPRVKCFEDCEEFKEEDAFYDARDAYTPEENQEANRKQEGDDWLSNDIKNEIQKLENLEELQSKITKPETNNEDKLEQLIKDNKQHKAN